MNHIQTQDRKANNKPNLDRKIIFLSINFVTHRHVVLLLFKFKLLQFDKFTTLFTVFKDVEY